MNISVIIPTHNRESSLSNALHSVLKQQLKPKEIIVVDDTLRDSTQKCIINIRKKYNFNIEYIRNHDNPGPSGSRNLGARIAKSNVLAFLDDDDMWSKKYLLSSMSILNKNKVDLVLTARWDIISDGNILPGKIPSSEATISDWIVRNHGCSGSNMIIYKDTFLLINGYDECLKVSEDKDFIIRAIMKGCKYIVNEDRLIIHDKKGADRLTNNLNKSFVQSKIHFYLKHHRHLTFLKHLKYFTQLAYQILIKIK